MNLTPKLIEMFLTGTKPQDTYSVLIVDDFADIHAAIKLSCNRYKFKSKDVNFDSAYTANQAINLLKQGLIYDVILLDVMMECESAGFKVIEYLNQGNLTASPKVIMLTGQPNNMSQLEAVENYEIDDYISKAELTNTRLKTALTTALRSAQKQKSQIYALKKLERYKSFIDKTVDTMSESLIVINKQGVIVFCNSKTSEMFNIEQSELHGLNVNELMPEDMAKHHNKHLAEYNAKTSGSVVGKTRLLRAKKKNGQEFPIELSLNQIEIENELFFLGVIRDVTERETNKQKIYELAYADSVTGIPNIEKFKTDIKNEHLSNYVFIGIQLESFYFVTQSYGQEVADSLLTLITHKIQESLPPNSTLYRLEGVRFAIRLTANKHDSQSKVSLASHAINEIDKAIKQPFQLGTTGHKLSAHYSVVESEPEDSVSSILLKLELTINRSFTESKRVSFYDDKLIENFFIKKSLEQALKESIDKSELRLLFQPQYNQQGKPVSSEVLMRWQSKKYGTVSPADFIPIAESNGFIIDLTRWLIKEVFNTIEQNQLKSSHRIAINISPTDILQPSFVEFLSNLLDCTNVNASQIRFELTERIFVSDIDKVLYQMEKVMELGFSFALDDFGTGYSSLSYLNILPIAELKIDKSFIDNMFSNKRSASIVETVFVLASSLGLTCIAEGVETSNVVESLNQFDGMLMQGYYFNKPLELDTWLTLLH